MFLIYGSLPGTKSSRYPTSPTVPGEQFQAPLQLGTCGRLGGTLAPQGPQGIPEGPCSRTALYGFVHWCTW